ncbi:MAG: DNA polymerase III subunit gamma/tau [Thiotrichales bacterium]|nr:DNA polymerase III subunit gamma/tau [Thiotrichales bacterium]
MSYSVLARKWRPKNFGELVGQQHVMQALANALDQQRLHHAYLFTGTRGVGKTTIARIFAKALNCEQGISSRPCGVCEVCRSINEGRFIDLIEVDAASKTKVDDTREILENVQFAPTQGRFKVYLIDEVHMLSKSSFNALLKTLEEPPSHVKFLLATTDPHKLPNTVLSRCLQFNLMRLTPLQIQQHLAEILVQEQIPFEESALALIAKSADGSVRDGLSLLDQAIAYGAGRVEFLPVQAMLGLVDQQFVLRILQALAADEGAALKHVMIDLAAMGVDYSALLANLSETLHQISYFQLFSEASQPETLPFEFLSALAEVFSLERTQLLYQISLLTKQDMQWAPDSRIGFEMGLMRMLAFEPVSSSAQVGGEDRSNLSSAERPDTLETKTSNVSGANSALALLKQGLQQSAAASVMPRAEADPEVSNVSAPPTSDSSSHSPLASSEDFALHGGDIDPSQSVLQTLDPLTAIAQMGSARNLIGKRSELTSPQAAAIEQQSPSSLSLVEQMQAGFLQQGKCDAPQIEERDFNRVPDLTVRTPAYVETEFKVRDQDSLSAADLSEPPPWAGAHPESLAAEVESEKAPEPESKKLMWTDSHDSAMGKVSMPLDAKPAEMTETAWQKMQQWQNWLQQMALKGMALEIASHSVLLDWDDQFVRLALHPQQDFSRQPAALQQLEDAIWQGLQRQVHFAEASAYDVSQLTPREYELQQQAQRQVQAQRAIEQDALLANLRQQFDLNLLPNSVRPR